MDLSFRVGYGLIQVRQRDPRIDINITSCVIICNQFKGESQFTERQEYTAKNGFEAVEFEIRNILT